MRRKWGQEENGSQGSRPRDVVEELLEWAYKIVKLQKGESSTPVLGLISYPPH